MKKLLCSLITGLLLQSCTSSPEDRAKELIKNHLYETLNDDKSYESVSYGGLDSTYTSVNDDSIYRKNLLNFDVFHNLFEDNQKKFNKYIHDDYMMDYCGEIRNEMHNYLDSMRFYAALADSIEIYFKPEFKGYVMRHSYRANNSMGAKTIGHYEFYFNKDITEIVNTIDISKNVK